MSNVGITIYGCENDEADVFRRLSSQFGIMPTIIGDAVSETNAKLVTGNQCISVGHKSDICEATLMALKNVGVKYISTRSIGCNHIDIDAARKVGIVVGNVIYSSDSVADYTLMLMLMVIRNAKSIVSGVQECDFRLDTVRGKELRDMTVGVVGVGHIGGAVMERLKGFGCRILTYSRGSKNGCLSLQELLEKSDIITLHVPLNTDTYHMIGGEQMKMIKKGAFLVNTGRGALVDTKELIKALDSGELGGAALDVLEGEEGIFYFDCSQKLIDNQFLLKLKKMQNVIISPHTAYYTGRVLYDITQQTILNCLDFERSHSYE